MGDIFIGGVPFLALGHHDGRFVRASGLFAFARRTFSDGYEVLHLELSADINRDASPGHPRWGWALAAGMDTLLVHLFGKPAELPADATPDLETVTWHAEAQVAFLESGTGEPPLEGDVAAVFIRARS
jgi:hypothetical protein